MFTNFNFLFQAEARKRYEELQKARKASEDSQKRGNPPNN